MKTERRHELQTNELAVWLTDAVETGKPYFKLVLGIVLAAGVLTGFYLVMTRRSKDAEQRGWTSYFDAVSSDEPERLEQVAETYPGISVGYWAHLSLGDRHLSEGVEQRFRDFEKSQKELRLAVEHYRAARLASDSLLMQRAGLGLGRAFEALQELDKAREEYRGLSQQWPDSAYAEQAAERLADLDRQSTKEFYDWFAKQDLKPKSDGEEMFPGFNLDGLNPAHGTGTQGSEEGGPTLPLSPGGTDTPETTPGEATPEATENETPATETPAETETPADLPPDTPDAEGDAPAETPAEGDGTTTTEEPADPSEAEPPAEGETPPADPSEQ